jgi:hypothetical protein
LVDWYKKEAAACDELKEKWAMFEQGYYLHVLEDTETDPREPEQPVEEKTDSATKSE